MGIKYYTHFVMNEKPRNLSEFSGVVELNRVPRGTKEIAALLARSLDLDTVNIRVLHWSRLH